MGPVPEEPEGSRKCLVKVGRQNVHMSMGKVKGKVGNVGEKVDNYHISVLVK